ncbi:transmembrane protein 208 isoform X2 [Cephus cinctus]|uniref:Transmembrane protein 208 n=1 Tax=Cephus cinctus TaxID=211228 RepID=A0AAJ7FPY1_CEPCN|nr:transmembrane protein 208 isoform X2 [Cephus cinctus]
MAPPTKSSKVATKGAKQIVEENVSTLSFYRNMVFGAAGIYLTAMMVFFEFTTLTITLTILSGIVYVASYQFMGYMAKAKYTESGQLLDSGVDLNLEGGVAEHVKDLIILTSGVQILSLISNYFWLLWLLVPLRGAWMLWSKLLSPWFFSAPPVQPEIDEKKQRKLERKMAWRH